MYKFYKFYMPANKFYTKFYNKFYKFYMFCKGSLSTLDSNSSFEPV